MNWGVNEVVDRHIEEIQMFFSSSFDSFSLALRVGTLFLAQFCTSTSFYTRTACSLESLCSRRLISFQHHCHGVLKA